MSETSVYPAAQLGADEDDQDSWSSSATSSDDPNEQVGMPDLSQMGNDEAAEAVFYQYRNAKKVWRRFTGKPARRFRRAFKRSFKHRKGKGKGAKGRSWFQPRGFFYTGEDVQVFLKGTGKGHRAHTVGKRRWKKTEPSSS